GDRPPEHRREVAARHLAHRHTVDHHRVVRTRRATPVDQQPSEPPPDTTLTFGLERPTTAELALVPPHDPTEAGLERRDPLPQLVAVEREPGLEPQRVACAEPRGRDAGSDDRPPE